MSAQHTQGRVTFREDGDACHWSMLTEDGRWWLAVLANGEQTSERQIANFRRIAACWNACIGAPTEDLESHGFLALRTRQVESLESERDAIKAQRDALLKALKSADEFIDGIRQDLHHERVADWYPEGAHNSAEAMSESMRLIGNRCADFVDASEAIAAAEKGGTP